MKARIVRYSFIGVVAVLIILCGMKFSNMYKDYQKLQFNQEQIDAQEILSFHFSNDNLLCRSAWKIGYWMGYDIVINVDDIEKEYLYAGDCCSTDEFVCVGNILNFIEEIVKNGGDPYWTINENQYRDFSKK